MRGHIKEIEFSGKKLFIYLPPSYEESNRTFPVLYAHDGQEINKLSEALVANIEAGFKAGSLQEFIWIGIYPERRQHEYTPWPAPGLAERFGDFEGNGKDYISFIVNELKPYIDAHYATKIEAEHTWMMGYSLGGLISLYSAYETSVFGKIGCICGSFWYQGMTDWVKTHKLLNDQIEVFIYYGKTEGKGKENIQKDAAKCAEEVAEYLSKHSSELGRLQVENDEGGHHHYVTARYEKTISWLAGKQQ